MYIYFKYAHKASANSVDEVPYVKHEAQLHRVLLPWKEDEATSSYRLSGVAWNTQYLALDGTDASATVISSNTMHRRYFQHAHFIPIVGVGKRGEY